MSAFGPDAATNPNLPHDSLVPQVIGICSAMMVLVTVVVFARFTVRLSLVHGKLGADDWFILAAWILAVAFDLDPINQTRFGLGQHIYDLPPTTNFSASLELYYFGEIIYYACVALTKVAILILYLRLVVQKTYRRIIWGVMAFVVTSAFACVTASIFQCTPVAKAWDTTGLVKGTCFNVNALFFANAGLDIVQDAIIYVLPMKMLYQLQIPKRQKFALMVVFAVGGFVVVTGMVRLNSLKFAQNTPDPSYNNFGAAVWSSIECNVGVVCASLPYFKPLIDRFFPSLMGRPDRSSAKMTPLPDHPVSAPGGLASSHAARSKNHRGHEFDLESGNDAWNHGSARSYGGGDDYRCDVTAGGDPVHDRGSSEEHLRGVERQGINKSTSVFVGHA